MSNAAEDNNADFTEQLEDFGEFVFEDEEDEGLDALPIQSQKSLFDYPPKDDDQSSYEEEDVVTPSEFSTTKYDLHELGVVDVTLVDRGELIATLKEIQTERRLIVAKNKFLLKQYMAYIKQTSWYLSAIDKFDDYIIFQDNRYFALLEKFERVRDDIEHRQRVLEVEVQTLQDEFQVANSNFDQAFEALMERELTVGRKIKPLKTSKQAWAAEVDHLLMNQRRRMNDVAVIRLAFVQLHYQLEKLQVSLEKCDNLGRGYSMMDYEYMLKKKEVYTEKSEEQKDHMKRIGDKNYSNAAIIRHIAEESDLYKQKIKKASFTLIAATTESTVEHSKAVKLLKRRAVLFKNIMKLREEIGLLESPFLLIKMEAAVKEIAKYKKRNENLRSKLRADDLKMKNLLKQKRVTERLNNNNNNNQ